MSFVPLVPVNKRWSSSPVRQTASFILNLFSASNVRVSNSHRIYENFGWHFAFIHYHFHFYSMHIGWKMFIVVHKTMPNENEYEQRRGGKVFFCMSYIICIRISNKRNEKKKTESHSLVDFCRWIYVENGMNSNWTDNCMKMTYRLAPQYWLCFDEPFWFPNDIQLSTESVQIVLFKLFALLLFRSFYSHDSFM